MANRKYSPSARRCEASMDIEIADIVISINGRDAGKRFVVIGTDKDYSLIANGKNRKLEKPKRKKNKHLKFENKASSFIEDKLTKNGKITNNELRRYLAEYAATNCSEGGMQECQKTT